MLFLIIIRPGNTFGLIPVSADSTRVKPSSATCENIKNPLGIDISNPTLSWILVSKGRNKKQTAYEILVSDSKNELMKSHGAMWQSGKILSDQSLHIEYKGKPLKSFTRYYWCVRIFDQEGKASSWSKPQWFETAMLKASDWKAKWISDGSTPYEHDEDFYKDRPNPLFCKTFKPKKKILSARLYISGLGYYEAAINGQKVGTQMLDPGWTNYSKQVLYSVYDVTSMIDQKVNTACIMLGNGWYNLLPLRFWGSKNFRNNLTVGQPVLKAQVRIKYTDGSADIVATDESWQTLPGPVIFNSVYLGEHYDARLELKNRLTRNTKEIKHAVAVSGPAGKLTVQMQPPIRVTKIVSPISIAEIKPGTFIVDMGQNFAGTIRIHIKGLSGTKVTFRYGEDKYPDGSLNPMTSVAGQIKKENGGPGAPKIAWQEDSYTLMGKGIEIWTPKFTFHGFRYVEVTGWPGKPTLQDIEGLRMSADLEQSGYFTCSNQMFNKLNDIIKWTFLSNVFSVQSDCPAREKLGYGGDLFCTNEAFLFNFNMANFYMKTVNDFVNDQRPMGGITETAPYVGIADKGPGDNSAPIGFQLGFPYLVKKIYDFYGDKRVIKNNYDALTRLANFLIAKSEGNLFYIDLSDHESLDAKPVALTASVFYYTDMQLMAEFARILNNRADSIKYNNLAHTIKDAIVSKFNVPHTGRFDNATQTAQIFALWSGVVPESEKDKVFEVLNANFLLHNGHLSTGIFGIKMMFDVLRKENDNDLAYQVANQRSFPGWGYMLDNGATTLWETWANSDNTYSKNHPMFGSVGEWFYRSLLGINENGPGFKRIIIKPQPAGDLTMAKGSFNSVYGKITSGWEIIGKHFNLKVEIPVNTSAEIWIPLKYGTDITESGKPISEITDIQFVKKEKDYTVYRVGSGIYSFLTN